MGAGLRDVGPKQVYSAIISATAGTGDVEIVAENAKKIVVINFLYTCSATQSTLFQSYNASTQTDLTGAMIVMANGWVKGHYNPDGHFQTIAGDSLVIERGGSIAIGGWLNYYLE